MFKKSKCVYWDPTVNINALFLIRNHFVTYTVLELNLKITLFMDRLLTCVCVCVCNLTNDSLKLVNVNVSRQLKTLNMCSNMTRTIKKLVKRGKKYSRSGNL